MIQLKDAGSRWHCLFGHQRTVGGELLVFPKL